MSRPLNVFYTNVSASTTAAGKQVVAAVSGCVLRVLGLQITPAAANSVTLQTSTGGALWGPYSSTGAKPFVGPPSAIGYCETAASRGIYMQLANAAAARVALQYQVLAST